MLCVATRRRRLGEPKRMGSAPISRARARWLLTRRDSDQNQSAHSRAESPPPMPPPGLQPAGKRRRDDSDASDEDDELQRALKLSMRRQVDERKEDDEMRRAIALSMRVF